MTKFEY